VAQVKTQWTTFHEKVVADRLAQGLPAQVEDQEALDDLVALVRAGLPPRKITPGT
jgi:hypothetical protein